MGTIVVNWFKTFKSLKHHYVDKFNCDCFHARSLVSRNLKWSSGDPADMMRLISSIIPGISDNHD